MSDGAQLAFARTQEFLSVTLSEGGLSCLLRLIVDELQIEYSSDHCPALFIQLPSAVFRSVCRDQPQAQLETLCLLLFAGINLHDDIADREVRPRLAGHAPSQLQLAATSLLSALPLLCLKSLPQSATQLLGERLLTMANGQYEDVSRAKSNSFDFDGVYKSVAEKSGAELALFARIGATCAGATEKVQDTYDQFGHALGIALQLVTDCFDLFQTEVSGDLTNGSRTLPICLYLDGLSDVEHAEAMELLQRAETDSKLHGVVQKRMRERGVLAQMALIIEVERQRAIRLLCEAAPLAEGKAELLSILERASLLPKECSGG